MRTQIILILCVLLNRIESFQFSKSPLFKHSLQVEQRDKDVEVKPSTTQLGVLTTSDKIKKTRTRKFNRQRLLKLGIAPSLALTLGKCVASASQQVTAIINPGLGVVNVPRLSTVPSLAIGSQRRLAFDLSSVASASQQVTAIENPGLGIINVPRLSLGPNHAFLAFAVAAMSIMATMLRFSGGKGYISLIHFMTKCLGLEKDSKDEIDQGFPKESSWGDYTSALDALKKRNIRAILKSLFMTRVDNQEDEAAKMLQQSKFFQEQQHKQHQHTVISFQEDRGIKTIDYPTNVKTSTWGIYKKLLSTIEYIPSEVDEEESNQNLSQTFDVKLSTDEELKGFDEKAQEFEETVMEEVKAADQKEDTKKSSWPPLSGLI